MLKLVWNALRNGSLIYMIGLTIGTFPLAGALEATKVLFSSLFFIFILGALVEIGKTLYKPKNKTSI